MVTMSDQAIRDMKWLIEFLPKFNGRAAWKSSRIVILQSDASDLDWGTVCEGQQMRGLEGTQETTEDRVERSYSCPESSQIDGGEAQRKTCFCQGGFNDCQEVCGQWSREDSFTDEGDKRSGT